MSDLGRLPHTFCVVYILSGPPITCQVLLPAIPSCSCYLSSSCHLRLPLLPSSSLFLRCLYTVSLFYYYTITCRVYPIIPGRVCEVLSSCFLLSPSCCLLRACSFVVYVMCSLFVFPITCHVLPAIPSCVCDVPLSCFLPRLLSCLSRGFFSVAYILCPWLVLLSLLSSSLPFPDACVMFLRDFSSVFPSAYFMFSSFFICCVSVWSSYHLSRSSLSFSATDVMSLPLAFFCVSLAFLVPSLVLLIYCVLVWRSCHLSRSSCHSQPLL